MKMFNAKVIASAVVGLAFIGAAPSAMAAWTAGSICDGDHTPEGPKPCFDYGDSSDGNAPYKLDQSAANDGPDNFFGKNNGDPFEFSGRTQLTCGTQNLDCNLLLEGKLGRNPDGSGGWLVGVEVSGADVSALDSGEGTPLRCSLVEVGGFNWYAADTSEHETFTDSGGVTYPFPGGNLVGNVGGAPGSGGIQVGLTFPPTTLASSTHVHGVTYDNATSTFSFDSTLYLNDGSDDPTNCDVDGDLTVENADYVHVH